MKRVVSTLASLVLCLLPAFAGAHDDNCGVSSDYAMSIQPQELVFTRHHGTPARVVMAGGTLTVDGKPVALSAADRGRVGAYEHQVRLLVPQVKAIAREAIGIAFDAVGQIAAAFATTPEQARASAEHVAEVGRELDRRIEASMDFDGWQDADVDDLVEHTVNALVPEIVGNVTAQALKVAFTGDDRAAAELEARADAVEKGVDQAVARRSADLKRRAEALCPELRALGRLQSQIDARLPGGTRLDLIRMDY